MVECTLSITHCLRLNLQLHTIDLVRTCHISSFCTVALQLAGFQLTRRIARSLCSRDVWTRTFPSMLTDAFADAHCCAYVGAFTDASVTVDNADASANVHRHICERICQLILGVRSRRERYLALSCGQW